MSAGLLAGLSGVVAGVSSEDSLGFAAARTLVRLGARIAITSRPARAARRARLAAQAGATVDVDLEASDDASIEAAVRRSSEALGGLDFVLHTLMHVPEPILARPLTSLGRDDLHAVIDAGVHSFVALAGAAAPWLERSASPRVVTITSVSGHRMTPGYHAAGIAKAALDGAVVYLAQELGPKGICVNAVSPPFVSTEGARRVVGDAVAAATVAHQAKRSPLRRATSSDEVADVIGFLVSPLARGVTGQTLVVDGGSSRLLFG
jgi:enoyl-[acyl-carrier protein] reductase I